MESHLPVEPIWNHGFLDKLPSSAKFSRAVQLEREKKEISITSPGSYPWVHQYQHLAFPSEGITSVFQVSYVGQISKSHVNI